MKAEQRVEHAPIEGAGDARGKDTAPRRRAALTSLTILLTLAGAGHALAGQRAAGQGTPGQTAEPLRVAPSAPQSPATAAPPIAEVPVAPVYMPGSGPLLLTNPVEALNDMASQLDKRADGVAMEVEGRQITQGEIADVIRAMPVSMASLGMEALYRRALDQLLRQKLLVIAAGKAGLDKDPVVKRREKAAAERALAEEWLTRAVGAAVTEDMVKARYQRDFAGRPGPEEVRARAILVPTETEARAVIAKAQAGGDFAALARQYSKDASVAAGGDLGYVRVEALGPEIGSAIFTLSPGQVTAYPIHTPAGYFVFRVEGRRQRPTLSLDEARGDLLRELRREAVVPVIQNQMATVKIREPGVIPQTPPPAPGPPARP